MTSKQHYSCPYVCRHGTHRLALGYLHGRKNEYKSETNLQFADRRGSWPHLVTRGLELVLPSPEQKAGNLPKWNSCCSADIRRFDISPKVLRDCFLIKKYHSNMGQSYLDMRASYSNLQSYLQRRAGIST